MSALRATVTLPKPRLSWNSLRTHQEKLRGAASPGDHIQRARQFIGAGFGVGGGIPSKFVYSYAGVAHIDALLCNRACYRSCGFVKGQDAVDVHSSEGLKKNARVSEISPTVDLVTVR